MAQKGVLYRHATGVGITCILYIEKRSLLVTADESGRVLINNISATQNSCKFFKTAAEMRSGGSLSQLLHNDSGTKLLLRGKDFVEVWTIEGEQVENTIPFGNDDGVRVFASHPLHLDHFISIGSRDMRIFSWVDALEVNTYRGDSQSVEVTVTPPTPTNKHDFHTKYISNPFTEEWSPPFLACLFKRNPASPSLKCTTLQIWPASSVVTSNFLPTSIPLSKFANQSQRVKQIIAVAGSLFLFLDIDLWVCSLDIATASTISNGVRRHFFLLSEWQSINRDFLVEYVPATREFLIAKKHQVLVVGRGLELEEPWIS